MGQTDSTMITIITDHMNGVISDDREKTIDRSAMIQIFGFWHSVSGFNDLDEGSYARIAHRAYLLSGASVRQRR